MHGMTEKIDKFAQFFNSGKILYSAMSYQERLAWKDEMKDILLTARAHLSAADSVDREESAKLTPEGRQWLTTNDDSAVNSDAINTPKVRKERMSKADKLQEQMKALGLDMADVKNIMGQVEKTAKEKDLNSLVFKKNEEKKDNLAELCRIGEHVVCVGRYTDKDGSHECSCDCHKVNLSVESRPAEPFNLGSLKFGS